MKGYRDTALDAPVEVHMTFIVLEGAAAILALLIGFEMRRQGFSWPSVIVRSLVVLAALSGVIVMWRGR